MAVMPYARNRGDGMRVYFEDDGGDGAAVVLHGGFLDSVGLVRDSSIAAALPTDEFRLIYVDHRGLGRSDKPHDPQDYAMARRVADATAVLEELGIERAHFIGLSWGGRPGLGSASMRPNACSRSWSVGGSHRLARQPPFPHRHKTGALGGDGEDAGH